MARDLIGSRIKALRQARGLSQDEVARLLGFKDRQTVSTIEMGTRRAAALIDASVDELPSLLAAHGVEHEVEL